ncbi:MAG TPA: hypothetical protein VF269_00090 [Rhodanobacteraceae bacterium]
MQGVAFCRRCTRWHEVLAGVALFAVCGVWMAPCRAQHASVLDRFDVGVGVYRATSSTTLGLRLPDGLFSTSVNLENNLGFGRSESLPRVRARVLIGDHQGLSLDYYAYRRVRDRYWQRTLAWQGKSYRLGARVHGQVAFAFGSVAWRWWFGRGDDVFGLGLGAGHYRASGRVSGRLAVNGDTLFSGRADTGTSAWAPLVQVGWRHALGQHWRLYLDAAGVFKGGGKLSGHIYNASLGITWLPVKHWAFALEYGINSIHVKQAHGYYDDSLDLQLYGPSIFVYLRY